MKYPFFEIAIHGPECCIFSKATCFLPRCETESRICVYCYPWILPIFVWRHSGVAYCRKLIGNWSLACGRSGAERIFRPSIAEALATTTLAKICIGLYFQSKNDCRRTRMLMDWGAMFKSKLTCRKLARSRTRGKNFGGYPLKIRGFKEIINYSSPSSSQLYGKWSIQLCKALSLYPRKGAFR